MLAAAEIYATWTRDLIFFLEPGQEPQPERARTLEPKGFGIERRRIHRLLGDEASLRALEPEGGIQVAREALVLWPRQRQTDLVAGLELTLDESGSLKVDEGFHADRPGLYAAGDLLYQGHRNINTAIHMGNMAAATTVVELGDRSHVRTYSDHIFCSNK